MDTTRTGTEPTFEAFDRLSSELTRAYRTLVAHAETLERQLADSRREKARLADRLGALLDSLPGAVVVFGPDGVVREANAAAFEWLGREPRDGGFWDRLRREYADPDARADDEIEWLDGRVLTVSRRFVAGRGETVLLLTDVTEQRRLQRELEQHRKLATMGEMAARLAHQLRTPLATALLYAGPLADGGVDAERRQRFAERVRARLRDLDRMTGDMLGYVRGAAQADERFTLAELLADVQAALAPGQDDGRCLAVRAGSAPAAHLAGDRDALRGALCNLAENAWQAGAGRVTVAARRDGARVTVVVHDDGPGVDEALRDRVFEPFFSERRGGTGLGLPVARSVAEAHGGALALADAPPGGGAAFELTLPLADDGGAS